MKHRGPAVEDRYQQRIAKEKASDSEVHRLRYVYFLNRLTELHRGDVVEIPERAMEIREVAALCRHERATHLGITEAEADSVHGTVIQAAKDVVDAEKWETEPPECFPCVSAAEFGRIMCRQCSTRAER